MRKVFIIVLSIFTAMESFAQNNTTDRKPVAAGRFYSGDRETLKKDMSILFKYCKKSSPYKNVRAIISPHAGYVFSGEIAAAAYYAIPSDASYKNIFIIGSSHVMYFDGASVFNSGDYITPLGKAKVNLEIANKLIIDNKVFHFPTDSHTNEHSIEVQIPFIQTHFKTVPPIVPIIIGTDNVNTVKKIAEALKPYFTPDNLFIISSDFSHYPSYKDAIDNDKRTAESIISKNPKTFLNTLERNSEKHIHGLVTSMCGWTSGLTLLYLTEGNDNFKYTLVDYSNSGDSPYGNKDEVVGYNAIVVTDDRPAASDDGKKSDEFSFSEADRAMLFKIARNSIYSRLFDEMKYLPDTSDISDALMKNYGAFVTLKIDGNLRGCIGRFISSEPLYKVIAESAVSSAFEDPRFPPLTKKEFKETDMEITILGPLKKIDDISQIVLGKNGIYIKKGSRAGTMLPQVATENGWTVEQFLGYTARDKAGIGWDGWRDAEIYIYDGLVLEDNRK
jgi:AmmeMemoRadiSam system protein B/AmmeMemoRadiSam system protein A